VPFNKYYQDELAVLRDLGREFALANPKLAPFLAESGTDPDVERLLEGVAFLTGRLREKLDDELPELTHGLIALLWPHYLRPLPAMSVLKFEPVVNAISGRRVVDRGTEVDSVPVDGTRCRFFTCYDVPVFPVVLARAAYRETGSGGRLTLTFALDGGAAFESLGLDALRLHLFGDPFETTTLYLWLCRHLAGVRVVAGEDPDAKGGFAVAPDEVTPAGLSDDEGLLPYPPHALPGFRLIQEYFALPEKFLFVDVGGLKPTAAFGVGDRFCITFTFDRPLPTQVRPTADHFRLYCTPVVNLFAHDADPIRLDQRKVAYRLRPAATDATHFEIYTVDRVEGWEQGTGERHVYRAFESFNHVGRGRGEGHFRLRRTPTVVGRGLETYITFGTGEGAELARGTETISVGMTCTNRNLPERLRAGDISVATGSSPEYVRFSNLSVPTPSLPPPMDEGLHWRLISHMSLHYVSLSSVEALRSVISTYDFRAHQDRRAERQGRARLEGIVEAKVEPAEHMWRGFPVRGWRTRLAVKESQFSGEGDLFLFAGVLDRFLAAHADVNSFHQLEVVGTETGETYRWPPMSGPARLV
jgi:type VI secretion system protein ImpG